jgi:hypothetical protein
MIAAAPAPSGGGWAMTSSLHLSDADFDAYLSERAASNAWSRPRMELKQRALVWARSAAARLAALGIELELSASDEHPSIRNKHRVDEQWIVFARDAAARDEVERLLHASLSIARALEDPGPLARHAFLALRVDAASIEVGFAVHPDARIDADNLRARLDASGDGADELVQALRALPEQFAAAAADERTQANELTAASLLALLDRSVRERAPLWIGWSVPRAVAIEHVDILDEQLEDAMVALAPIYRLGAWARDNDLVGLDERLAGALLERARTHAEMAAATERWRSERTAAIERSRDLARAGRAEEPSASPPSRPTLATLIRPTASLRDAPERRAARAASPPTSPVGAIEKGARVRVLAGPFADKVGVVAELDGRGGARVLLGLLATRVELACLEPVVEGRDRPPLQSSHRRPTLTAPRKAR